MFRPDVDHLQAIVKNTDYKDLYFLQGPEDDLDRVETRRPW